MLFYRVSYHQSLDSFAGHSPTAFQSGYGGDFKAYSEASDWCNVPYPFMLEYETEKKRKGWRVARVVRVWLYSLSLILPCRRYKLSPLICKTTNEFSLHAVSMIIHRVTVHEPWSIRVKQKLSIAPPGRKTVCKYFHC